MPSRRACLNHRWSISFQCIGLGPKDLGPVTRRPAPNDSPPGSPARGPGAPRRYVRSCGPAPPSPRSWGAAPEAARARPPGLSCAVRLGPPPGPHESAACARINIPALADSKQGGFAAARVLPGHEPEEGRQLSAVLEAARIPHRGHEGARCNGANPRDLRQPAAGVVLPVPGLDLPLQLLIACYYAALEAFKESGPRALLQAPAHTEGSQPSFGRPQPLTLKTAVKPGP